MNEATRNEVVRRWRAGASMRAIARALDLSRNTVRRALAGVQAARAGETPPPAGGRPSLLDPYEAVIGELLGRYPDLTAARVFQELRARGFTGGYTIVRRRVGQLRPRPAPAPVIRFETAPGAQAQADYATYDIDFTEEGRRRVHLFSYLLGYSRRQYLRFVEAQDFETTLRQHVRAFEHLGGVAATCLYDNLKVVVTGYDGDVPIYNTRFLAFATHYGFRPVACRPRRPQTKGKVERPFHLALGLGPPRPAGHGAEAVVGSKGQEARVIARLVAVVGGDHDLEVVVQAGGGHAAEVREGADVLTQRRLEILGLDEA